MARAVDALVTPFKVPALLLPHESADRHCSKLLLHRFPAAAPVRLTTEFAYEGRWDPVMTWTIENLITDSIVSRCGVAAASLPAVAKSADCRAHSQPRITCVAELAVVCCCPFRSLCHLLQEDWMFDVPEPWAAAPKKACKWVMGGWPQMHLFSHYLRV